MTTALSGAYAAAILNQYLRDAQRDRRAATARRNRRARRRGRRW